MYSKHNPIFSIIGLITLFSFVRKWLKLAWPCKHNPLGFASRRCSIIGLSIMLISCEYDDKSEADYVNYYADGEGKYVDQGDKYQKPEENPFVEVSEQPVSTFSIDADGGSYANVRRFIMQEHFMPPKAAVRTEEMINYFDLDYPFDDTERPISLNGEVATCPWNKENKLIRIGIQGKPLAADAVPVSNFVLLIDVSGSMASEDKLDLIKSGFIRFVDQMSEKDRLGIVTYAGNAAVLLESTSGSEKEKIKEAIRSLGAGGGTAGAEGIITAYKIAQNNFIEGGNNRVIVGTDGDFNIGPSSHDELIKLIEEKRESGIFITVIGVGRGNLNEVTMEQIANKGNGTYEYLDNIEQMKKVFIYEYNKFFTVAKDVKVQVEFNAELVKSYRLIGYENRMLASEDFEDDSKDAGEIGAGQNVTALYEIVPAHHDVQLREQPTFTIDFRYKEPESDTSNPLSLEIFDDNKSFSESTDQMKFVSAVASFSMLITDSPYKGSSSYEGLFEWLSGNVLPDENGFKKQFMDLIGTARSL